jgi:hypothetical protein
MISLALEMPHDTDPEQEPGSRRRAHERLGHLLRNVGRVLEHNDPVAGERLFRVAIEMFEELDDPFNRAAAVSGLGGCLAMQGRYDQAERLLLESFPILAEEKSVGALHSISRITLQRIVHLYEAADRPEELARFRAMAPPGIGADDAVRD